MKSDITSNVPPAAPQSITAAPAAAVPAAPAAPPRPRLWPGVLIVALQWPVIKLGLILPELQQRGVPLPSWLDPEDPMLQFQAMFMGPMVATGAFLLWWLFFSRIRWTDRILGVLAFAAAVGLTFVAYHPSLRPFGLLMTGLPLATTAWVGWLLLTPFVSWPVRKAGLVAAVVLAFAYPALLRMDGVSGAFAGEISWRWTPTQMERTVARLKELPAESAAAAPAGAVVPSKGDWPAFRGPQRDGRLTGVRIATDWNQRPPRELWRRPVGPGWSSFAAVGDRLFTQEQREGGEAVVCYHAGTGKEIWVHVDPALYEDIVSGPGPRATPTFHNGKLYTFGAKGLLNCLDAATGKALWSKDVPSDAQATPPKAWWGFSASPLVVKDLVMVYTGCGEGKGLIAYNAESGDLKWAQGKASHSYCSPQLSRLGGVEQVLVTTEAGVTAFHPATGEVLWEHSWPANEVARIAQPAVVGESDLLVGTGLGVGTRRVHLNQTTGSWKDEEVWTTRAIRPYFKDVVLHKDRLYGFDGSFLTCLNVEDGKRLWRERGKDDGQILLLADQGLLLVLYENGDVALVEANPKKRTEVGRFTALKPKTWNHPVVAHGKLVVRNGEEAACYQLDEAAK
jgi:outer membrane protein assembly factor BamB